MQSSSYILNIATDVGNGKVNTGVNFYSRPISVRQVLVAAEELYTAELREFNKKAGVGSLNAKFQCVLALVMANPSSTISNATSSTTSTASEKWQELTDPLQLYPNCQVYVFDSNSPAPERGVIPRAQLVVDADRISSVAVSRQPRGADNSSVYSTHGPYQPLQNRTRDREESAATTASVNIRPTFSATGTGSIDAASLSHTAPSGPRQFTNEYAGTNATPKTAYPHNASASSNILFNRNQPTTTAYTTDMNASDTYRPAVASHQQQQQGPADTVERAEGRRYLFRQLRNRCASLGQGNGTEIPAQSLHGVLVQNEMFFSTSEFAEMTNNKFMLGEQDWADLTADFAPVIDVLYDRIAAKTAQRNQRGEDEDKRQASDRMRSRLDDLEEEEAKLLARQAAIREEMAALRRELQRHEQQIKVANDERAKEWDVLSKYVALKLRQHRLRKEESQINHQLSLL